MISPTVYVCAPSRAPVKDGAHDPASIDRAQKRLEALGWRVMRAQNVGSLWKSYAGTHEERARGFEEAMTSPEADIVMALRGGCGALQILDKIDWKKVGDSHAVFMGFSDLTAINAALYVKCGMPSWQGPTMLVFARDDEERIAHFTRAVQGPGFELTQPAQGKEGRWEGTLWGGNLAVLVSLLGTPYFPQIEGGILYLEDVNEPAWRVARMMEQLRLAGVFAKQKAVIACDFSGADASALAGGMCLTMADVLADISDTAVVSGLRFGHCRGSVCLPFGVPVVLTLEADTLTLRVPEAPLPAERPHAQTPNGPMWWT